MSADKLLLSACRKGMLKEARAALARGANVNVVDSDGNTPLLRAVKATRAQLVQELPEAGADMGAKNNCRPFRPAHRGMARPGG